MNREWIYGFLQAGFIPLCTTPLAFDEVISFISAMTLLLLKCLMCIDRSCADSLSGCLQASNQINEKYLVNALGACHLPYSQ